MSECRCFWNHRAKPEHENRGVLVTDDLRDAIENLLNGDRTLALIPSDVECLGRAWNAAKTAGGAS